MHVKCGAKQPGNVQKPWRYTSQSKLKGKEQFNFLGIRRFKKQNKIKAKQKNQTKTKTPQLPSKFEASIQLGIQG